MAYEFADDMLKQREVKEDKLANIPFDEDFIDCLNVNTRVARGLRVWLEQGEEPYDYLAHYSKDKYQAPPKTARGLKRVCMSIMCFTRNWGRKSSNELLRALEELENKE